MVQIFIIIYDNYKGRQLRIHSLIRTLFAMKVVCYTVCKG